MPDLSAAWKKSTRTVREGDCTYQAYNAIGRDEKGDIFCPECAAGWKRQILFVEHIQYSLDGKNDRHTYYVRCKKCSAAYTFQFIQERAV